MNKIEFVRSQPLDMKSSDVVLAAAAAGIDIALKTVQNTRGKMKSEALVAELQRTQAPIKVDVTVKPKRAKRMTPVRTPLSTALSRLQQSLRSSLGDVCHAAAVERLKAQLAELQS